MRFLILFCIAFQVSAQQRSLQYTVSAPKASNHYFHIDLQASAWTVDTLTLKMPRWTPGYYQLLYYANHVEGVTAKDIRGKDLPVMKVNDNTWKVPVGTSKTVTISYDVKAEKKFVAQPYVSADYAYLVPAGLFLYVEGNLNVAASVKLELNPSWKIATGLVPVLRKLNEYAAADFDILYDCPILAGPLEELPSFDVRGVEHRFIGYDLGTFDHARFMKNLQKVTASATRIIGDIPFYQYTFLAIGPGRGGIEHLNNTTVSFSGDGLDEPEAMNRMMNFLAHEYFHHYNVKRIRPVELGPFDYDKGSRTNLLWVSEGLSVYYEYLIVARAGLADEKKLFANFEGNINAHENNPGRFHQSLTQASYKTWSDGPFGKSGEEADKSISYYDKGPIVGLLLDFAIRQSTQNRSSLDDVMRLVYWKYYKNLKRGFTDAEFQQACEEVAGASLAQIFDYVYTTKELDYNTYLGYAGLKIINQQTEKGKQFLIQRIDSPNELQVSILKTWLGDSLSIQPTR
jgi:predicted metalloprotease with PDZ domain